MDTPPGGGMVGETPWDYEFTGNPNQVTDSFDFGIGEPNVTDFSGYSNGFEDPFQFDHQSQTNFSFTSLLQDFETDHAFAEYQEYFLNQQSNLITQPSEIVQNHVVSSGEGEVVMEESPPDSSMVHDHGLSPEEEKAMLEFTPRLEDWEMMMMEELAPNPSRVHDHVLSSDKAMLEFMSAPRLTYCNGAKPRVKWTPGLHAWFVSAVKQLGGCETATPERILSLMDVPGLTRFHIKSHLQKYRNGGCWLVDGFDRSQRGAARRASVSHSNAPTRKVQRKRKAKQDHSILHI